MYQTVYYALQECSVMLQGLLIPQETVLKATSVWREAQCPHHHQDCAVMVITAHQDLPFLYHVIQVTTAI